MCAASLSLFAGYSVKTDELNAARTGHGGRLDWAFYVGIGGAATALVAGVLFYVDGYQLAKTYQPYKPPTVAVNS